MYRLVVFICRITCGIAIVGVPDYTLLAQQVDQSPDVVEQGLHNLNAACGRCHGRNGKGSRGPDLTTGQFRHAKTDEDLLKVITTGIPGRGMPGNPPMDDFYQPIIAYLRAEAKRNPTKLQPPSGNIARGYELFKQHKCASCHWTGNAGGRLGTDLSRMASTADHVRNSMLNPNQQIDSAYQRVHLLTLDGQVLAGRRLHENSHHLLMMDQQERLMAISKQELDQIERPPQSLMPNFSKDLSPQDIEDVTTYIWSLRR